MHLKHRQRFTYVEFNYYNIKAQGYGFEKIIVIIICLSFLVLLIISLIWVLFYYFQRFRLLHRQYAVSIVDCIA